MNRGYIKSAFSEGGSIRRVRNVMRKYDFEMRHRRFGLCRFVVCNGPPTQPVGDCFGVSFLGCGYAVHTNLIKR